MWSFQTYLEDCNDEAIYWEDGQYKWAEPFTGEEDYYEDIKEVKPGGHFLTQTNTLTACRSSEFLMPLLSDRNAFENWVDLGRPDLYEKAQKKVEEILATPQKHPLPDDVIAKLEAIVRRAEEEL